jgi:predicted RNase H-like nuclease (RuvC/YqgF family)
MNKVKLLIVTLLLSSIAFSQSATDTSKIVLSYPVAKMIAKDLIKGDSALSLLKNTEKELTLTQQKSKRQDSLIASYRLKERNYMMQIGNERQKVEGWQEQYQVLQKENKRLKAKYRFTKIVSYAIIGGLGYLYITK